MFLEMHFWIQCLHFFQYRVYAFLINIERPQFLLPGLQLRNLLKWPRPLPLEDERVRLLHEVPFHLELFAN